MKIVSLTGKSGTGKSYQATALAQQRNIDAIIDDGLFIYKGSIAAGASAKRCTTKAAAMRTALFNLDENRAEVVNAIVKYHPNSILIIGTSDRMTDIIAETLGLHKPDERIYIEDITSEEQRQEADYWRNVQGEHVIPAPMGQLRRDFAGYFMNPVRKIRNMAFGNTVPSNQADESNASEHTVVRPQYSYFGTFSITERALRDAVNIIASRYADDIQILVIMNNGKQTNMEIILDVRIVMRSGIIDTISMMQADIRQAIEAMTSFSVSCVNVRIKDAITTQMNR